MKNMIHLPLVGRCRKLREEYGINICPFTLRRYYLMAKVRYKKPKRWMESTHTEQQLKIERMAFLTTLLERIASNQLIIYFDECK